jgi:peptidoglycan/LPS O-acetylase OafA/YrhL
MIEKRRIPLLDSFRFLAIISVMLFHYTWRWTLPYAEGNFYPFGGFYKGTFQYGEKGVQFFFIISGFVISYTLDSTDHLSAFFKNRLIRLLPPMIVWSVITYLTFTVLDQPVAIESSHQLRNFLPSLTFINPKIWTLVFPNMPMDWLDGSYWTLWVEIQFYLVAGLVFFMNKGKFLRNILMVTLVLVFAAYIPTHFSTPGIIDRLSPRLASIVSSSMYINRLFLLGFYICYFTLGVVFHHLYARKSIKLVSFEGISIIAIFCYQLYACVTNPVRIIFLVMIALFVLMIYKDAWLRFLEAPTITRIGAISYSVYLSHQNIGVLLMHKYGGYLGKWSPLSVPIVMILIICLSEISYRFVEQKLGRFLKGRMFRRKPVLPNDDFVPPLGGIFRR